MSSDRRKGATCDRIGAATAQERCLSLNGQLASYGGKVILMAAVAYRRPLSAETQKDFDKLDVRDTVQEVIECSKCKGEYDLVVTPFFKLIRV
jgi:hypothetical protein